MRKLIYIWIAATILNTSCGTLGGFNNIRFPVSKPILKRAIDLVYEKFPQYAVPQNWQKFDTWEKRGYGFLDGTIFYFRNKPEEMYYVTFIGDSATQANPSQIEIAIRAVSKGSAKWLVKDDLGSREQKRIVNRFRSEIVLKLEFFTQSKSE